MEFLYKILDNPYYVWGIMAVVVFAFTQGLKWLLVKPYTNKIKNEKRKKMVNAVILLIAFAVAIGIEVLYAKVYLKSGVSLYRAFTGWSGSSLVYSWVERFLGKKIPNPMKTEEGKMVVELVENVVADNKIDGNDKHAVADFWNKVK